MTVTQFYVTLGRRNSGGRSFRSGHGSGSRRDLPLKNRLPLRCRRAKGCHPRFQNFEPRCFYSAIEAKASNVLLLKRVRRRKVMNGLFGRKAAHALFLLSLCLSAPLNAMAEPATADRGVAIHSLNAPRSAILLAETKAGGNATGAGGGATVAAAQGVSQLSLQDLMALAVRTHPSVGAKKADANAAEYDVQSARWQYFPTPSVSARQDGKNGTTTVVAVQQPTVPRRRFRPRQRRGVPIGFRRVGRRRYVFNARARAVLRARWRSTGRPQYRSSTRNSRLP